jgi:hypothetical protein
MVKEEKTHYQHKKYDEVTIHTEKSMFIGHFTSIFHRNCVGAIFNTQCQSNHNYFIYNI